MPYIENYRTDPETLIEGQVVDTEQADIVSRTVETAGGIGFGKLVKKGAKVRGITSDVSAAAVGDLEGITVLNVATGARATNPDIYPQNDTASVMRKGVIAVKVTDAGGVAYGDPVWIKKSDGTFSNADVGTSGGIRLAGARWESNAANGEIARVRVNFDVPAVAGA